MMSSTTNTNDQILISSSPTRSPTVSKRRSVNLFHKTPKNFTLFTDVTNTSKSPANIHLSSTPSKSKLISSPAKIMGNPKLSKKALTLQVAQLEQELKLVKYKAGTLAEQNEELKRQVETTAKADSVESTQLQALEAENKKLKQELDSYITKKWRDFCAVQDSPTPYKKRIAYSNRDHE